jgi:multiple sugar transport system permease protein
MNDALSNPNRSMNTPPTEHMAQVTRSVRNKQWLSTLTTHLLLILFCVVFMLPFLWMISSSLKSDEEIFQIPPALFPSQPMWGNYLAAVQTINFFGYLWNTIVYSALATFGAVISNAMIAYGFARIRWPGRDILFFFVIATMMLPWAATMIPLYVLFTRIGWVPSLKPLVVPAFFGSAYYIFLLRQFLMTLPTELDDAARIDGCNEWGIFRRIVLPLAKPALTAVALFELLWAWNNFLGPLIYLRDPDTYTLSVGIQLYFTQHGAEWGLLMAAGTLFTLPMVVLFFFAQRTFIEGITLTGIKG